MSHKEDRSGEGRDGVKREGEEIERERETERQRERQR